MERVLPTLQRLFASAPMADRNQLADALTAHITALLNQRYACVSVPWGICLLRETLFFPSGLAPVGPRPRARAGS